MSQRVSFRTLLLPAMMVVVLAMIVLYRDRYAASDLTMAPDSVEYAAGGYRIASTGRYEIVVCGQHFPPRYAPWFSLLFVAPAYLILGPDPGNAIFPVTAMGVLGVTMAFLIGRRISGLWGGVLASVLVLLAPRFRSYGRQVLTDVPCAALTLLQGWLYVRWRSSGTRSLSACLCAGSIAACCAALRPLCYACIIPFVPMVVRRLPTHTALPRVALLLAPGLILTAATSLHNHTVFGSAFRSGYHFWCAVPFDYPSLAFSPAYLGPNLRIVALSGLLPLALLAFLLWIAWHRSERSGPRPSSDNRTLRDVLVFVLLATGPVVVVHQLYFFPDSRFLLQGIVMLAVLCGGLLGMWLRRVPQGVVTPALAGALVLAVGLRVIVPDVPPTRRIAVDRIARHTPSNAVVISSLDPVSLEFLLGPSSHRRIVPLSRSVEYAGKVVSRQKVRHPDPPPVDCWDHRCAGLIRGGATEAVPVVAAEALDWLALQVARGAPVYLDVSHSHRDEENVLAAIARRFVLQSEDVSLYRLAATRSAGGNPPR